MSFKDRFQWEKVTKSRKLFVFTSWEKKKVGEKHFLIGKHSFVIVEGTKQLESMKKQKRAFLGLNWREKQLSHQMQKALNIRKAPEGLHIQVMKDGGEPEGWISLLTDEMDRPYWGTKG